MTDEQYTSLLVRLDEITSALRSITKAIDELTIATVNRPPTYVMEPKEKSIPRPLSQKLMKP